MKSLNERDIASTVSYRYHAATKHTVEKLYGGGWALDWANQPDPFRRYIGTETVPLPPPERPPAAGYFERHPTEPLPWNLQRLSQFLYYSVAISAWKEIKSQGARWSLRVNPSAGNLHPTETHIAVCGVEGLSDGVYHFRVDTFALECRAKGDVRPLLHRLRDLADVPPSPVAILLSSIVWRQAWKYRERAFRYCLHDLGHALACVDESLQGLGHRPEHRLLFDDEPVAKAFGLCDTDEFPAALVAASRDESLDLGEIDASGDALVFCGSPNALSESATEYRSIAQIREATASAARTAPETGETQPLLSGELLSLGGAEQTDVDLWTLVRQRRSAVGFDGRTRITAEALGAILRRATESPPSEGVSFFVHLFVFVHRVDGIEPGIYYYDRAAHGLVVQETGDVRGLATRLALGQEIAGDSAFAVAMMADFPAAVRSFGERAYRVVHVEAGAIGQGLYLGAEAVGVSGTGIGAFFDDDVSFSLKVPAGLETVYMFTVGGGLDDSRIQVCKSYDFE